MPEIVENLVPNLFQHALAEFLLTPVKGYIRPFKWNVREYDGICIRILNFFYKVVIEGV